MPNTSATGGYLAPAPPIPLDDDSLADFFQEWILGIVGLTGDLVRPRWQPEATNIPPITVTWLSLGITKREPDSFANIDHGPTGDVLTRHEIITIHTTCYGPLAYSTLATLRDGMQIAQNREVLFLAEMGYVGCGSISNMPELVKELWYYRADMEIQIKRKITRTYPVEDLVGMTGEVITDTGYSTQLLVNAST